MGSLHLCALHIRVSLAFSVLQLTTLISCKVNSENMKYCADLMANTIQTILFSLFLLIVKGG